MHCPKNHHHSSNLPIMPPLKTLTLILKTLTLISVAAFLLFLILPHPSPFSSPVTIGGGGGGEIGLRHLAFGIASSARTFEKRKEYIRLWWRPGARGFVFVEKRLKDRLKDSGEIPAVLVSEDTARFPYTYKGGFKSAVRVARIAKEVVDKLDADKGIHYGDVKWIVLGDDDTVFFMENLVKTLAKYNWEHWYYIGGISESVEQTINSFGMAFGGGGIAISYPLARILSKVLDSCLMRYGHVYGSDARIFACLAELGIGLTLESGFHQVDLRGDLFGMLTSHPLAPLVSLHHLEVMDPLYPGMNHTKSLEHLFQAVSIDSSRILQQTVCYDHSRLRTISVSWGYAVQVYEGNILLPDLLPLQQTFTPWRQKSYNSPSLYMFKTRIFSGDPCKRPAIFFLENVLNSGDRIESSYKRHLSGDCQQESDSIKNLQKIKVLSDELHSEIGQLLAPRRHCCDVLASSSEKIMEINIRKCKDDELIVMKP